MGKALGIDQGSKRIEQQSVSLQICIDAQRLQYLLENRLLLVEEMQCCSGESKAQVRRLLLRNTARLLEN